jgi:hypothetical protein
LKEIFLDLLVCEPINFILCLRVLRLSFQSLKMRWFLTNNWHNGEF